MTQERAARSVRRGPAPQHSWLGIARVCRDGDITSHSNAPPPGECSLRSPAAGAVATWSSGGSDAPPQ